MCSVVPWYQLSVICFNIKIEKKRSFRLAGCLRGSVMCYIDLDSQVTGLKQCTLVKNCWFRGGMEVVLCSDGVCVRETASLIGIEQFWLIVPAGPQSTQRWRWSGSWSLSRELCCGRTTRSVFWGFQTCQRGCCGEADNVTHSFPSALCMCKEPLFQGHPLIISLFKMAKSSGEKKKVKWVQMILQDWVCAFGSAVGSPLVINL